MKTHITDEKTGIRYTLYGDYYLPDLELPEQKSIGIWGQQHLQYLKQHRKTIYNSLFLAGKLNDHLADIDKQADEMFRRFIKSGKILRSCHFCYVSMLNRYFSEYSRNIFSNIISP